jgi:hypothetical protein
MSVPDERLAAALKTLFETEVGFWAGILTDLEIGQLENLNYWVEYKGEKGREWFKDDIGLDEAIGHFLRLRKEHEVGLDIESDLDNKRRIELGIKPEDG